MSRKAMRTRRWIQSGILILLGLYLLETLLTGEITYYVNVRYEWLAVLAGVILLALGAVNVAALLRERPDETGIDEHKPSIYGQGATSTPSQTGHEHGGVVSWPVLALVALPFALGVLVPARPLGATAISGSGISTSINPTGGSVNFNQVAVPPGERNILDWVRAFSTSSPEEFANQPGDIIGFVYRDIRFAEANQFMVTRFTVSCCVADAVAIGVIVEAESAKEYPSDSWLRVRGKFSVREFDGRRVPVLVAEAVEPATQPERPYLYP
jgi:uncharacterized repeat protein (TIGR03943 family)